jgi:hypothetical protein
LAALKWNGWQHSSGIGGSFEPEYACGQFYLMLSEMIIRYNAHVSMNRIHE